MIASVGLIIRSVIGILLVPILELVIMMRVVLHCLFIGEPHFFSWLFIILFKVLGFLIVILRFLSSLVHWFSPNIFSLLRRRLYTLTESSLFESYYHNLFLVILLFNAALSFLLCSIDAILDQLILISSLIFVYSTKSTHKQLLILKLQVLYRKWNADG
jgi:hypothetical protein